MNKLLLSALFIWLTLSCHSQSNAFLQKDTTLINHLPNSVREQLLIRLNDLANRDTLNGSFLFSEDSILRIFDYKIFFHANNIICDYLIIKTNCINCWDSKKAGIAISGYIYCCKDPKHKPKETASTKAIMLSIQEKKKCSIIGVCIL